MLKSHGTQLAREGPLTKHLLPMLLGRQGPCMKNGPSLLLNHNYSHLSILQCACGSCVTPSSWRYLLSSRELIGVLTCFSNLNTCFTALRLYAAICCNMLSVW
jgi:hypothetical protein